MPYLRSHRIQADYWSEAEDATLVALYGSESARALGRRLGRSENAVWLRARQLGFDKRGPVAKWTEDELAELRRCYATEPVGQIAKRLGRSASAVQQQARVLGLQSKKTLVNAATVSNYFHVIDTDEKAYLLGLLAADGCVGDEDRVTLGLQAKDEHLVTFARDRIAPLHKITRVESRKFVSFSVQSRQLAEDLSRWGIVPRKSYVLAWPNLGKFQRSYLLGYFDGDGWASTARGRYPTWGVCSGSRGFVVSLVEYVESQAGVSMDQIYTRKGASLHQVAATGHRAYVIDKWLHEGMELGLSRKRFAETVTDRYENSPNNRRSSWEFTAEYKAAAVAALLQERRLHGVKYGDVTRVAERFGVDRGNLRRWALQHES